MEVPTIRPLNYHEVGIHELCKKDCYIISYVLRISTPRPMTSEEGLRITQSLYRKCPNLRLRVVEKDDGPHWASMEKEKLDFEVVENADIFKSYNDFPREYKLNFYDGPHWCVRLLPYSPEQESYIRETTSLDGEKPRFESVCHMVLLFSHTIADGYSCVRIIRTLLSLIDAVMTGEQVDDSKQIGKLLNQRHKNELQDQIKQKFEEDPNFLKKRKDYVCSFPMETLFEKAYPVAPFLPPKTVCKVHIVDEMRTKKFIARCKKEGLTIHTGFCALVERTAIRMMVDKGFDKDTFTISSLQAADSRVYFKDCEDEFGVGLGEIAFTHQVSTSEILNDFWSAAKKFHTEFKEEHSQMPGLEDEVIDSLCNICPVEYLPTEGLSVPSNKMSYYSTTNMRDVTPLLHNVGEHVQLEFSDWLTTQQLFPSIWMNTFVTFRGRFIHSFQYNSHLMDSDVAHKFSDLLFEMFDKVCSE